MKRKNKIFTMEILIILEQEIIHIVLGKKKFSRNYNKIIYNNSSSNSNNNNKILIITIRKKKNILQ